MAKYGVDEGAFVYVADSALVTDKNLENAERTKTKLLSRLPATYESYNQVINAAVTLDDWTHIGVVAEPEATQKRPAAQYKVCDLPVRIYERDYRAVVVHSSAHDKRRHKRIDRQIKNNRQLLEKECKTMLSASYFCEADALAAAEKLWTSPKEADLFNITTDISKKPKYNRGRPRNGETRQPVGFEFVVTFSLVEDDEKIDTLRQEAGCFVLLTNLSSDLESVEWSAEDLLKLYKNQNGIERNFGFLKDPVIINSVFLKKGLKIEVLGMILLIALLIWRLIEREMRRYINRKDTTITGWVKRKTKRPTAFMMSTKFSSVLVLTLGRKRKLARPLKAVQLEYLRALGVSSDVFLIP